MVVETRSLPPTRRWTALALTAMTVAYWIACAAAHVCSPNHHPLTVTAQPNRQGGDYLFVFFIKRGFWATGVINIVAGRPSQPLRHSERRGRGPLRCVKPSGALFLPGPRQQK